MSNLTIRNENKMQKANTNGGDWYPFRTMRELLNWDPFREMGPMLLAREPAFMPNFEVSENKDGYLFKADLPGMKESDLNISLTGNRLMIAGKREFSQEQKNDTYYISECSYGEFSRSFTLPDGADTEHVKAELKDGVLHLEIPKKPTAQTKQIPLQATKAKV